MPDRIIVVPSGTSLAKGFQRARPALQAGETVRILGCGITYPDTWPSWAKQARNLSLVELGAYELGTRMEASRPLSGSLRSWCDEVFKDLVEGLGGAEVFSGGAAGRLLQDSMDSAAIVNGIRALHRSSIVEVVDPRWAGKSLLVQNQSAPRSALARTVLPGIVIAGLLASSLRMIREYARGSSSRDKMRASREGEPTLWLAVIPDTLRASKHLIDTLGLDTIKRGDPLGILLIQSWGVGTREPTTGALRGDAVWPALAPLAPYFPERIRVAQAVMPARRLELLRAVLQGVLASMRATARVVRRGGPQYATLRPFEMARLLSHDVLRATLAAKAACQAGAAFAPGSTIVFCAANLPIQAAPERVLSRLGVTTAEYMHGLGSDSWHGAAESHASTRIVWTQTDQQGQRPTGQTTIAAGLPIPPARRTASGFRNILILTNYFHRDIAVPSGGTKRAPYQRELLAVPELLRRELRNWPLNFRWRPHPAEIPYLIAHAYAKLCDVELSQGSELEEDLEWADLVVSPHSSAAVQAIFVGIPVFVHLRPENLDSPFMAYVSDTRRFQTAEQAVQRIAPCLSALARGDSRVLDPESEARIALVGEAGPRSLSQAIDEWRTKLDQR